MPTPSFVVTAVFVLVLRLLVPVQAQAPSSEPAPATLPSAEAPSFSAAARESTPLKLYRALRDLSLDPNEVYKIREAFLDLEDMHIALNDGVIAFTHAVNGRITGAYFRGSGEILVIPPDKVERSSLALHTGSAVLEEQFRAAFLRFNDDTAEHLRSSLREKQDGAEFVAEYNPFVGRMGEQDALRLLASFLRSPNAQPPDRVFRARLDGVQLGIFDVVLDTLAGEQIAIARFARSSEDIYYDLLASFPMRSARASAAQNTDASPQDLGYAGALGSVRVRNYVIRARIEPPHTLQAQATLDTEVTASGERVVFLELSRYLKVRSVQAGGKPLEFLQNEALEGSALARRGNDLVALIFPQPLAQGQHFELQFDYGGPVLSEAGGGLISVGARGTWYPNHGRSMANFDLEFRAPKEWTLVATGKRVSQRTEGTEQITHWVSERPLPMAGFNLGEYTRETAKAGDVSIEVYAARGMEKQFPTLFSRNGSDAFVSPPVPLPPRDPIRSARGRILPDPVLFPPPPAVLTPEPDRNAVRVAREAEEMIEFLARHSGPFPYSSLVVSQKPGPVSQGWPGLVYLSSYAFLSPQQREALKLPPYQSIMFGGLMTRHEVAHQWWGDLVGWKTYRDQWLVEALSTYSALLSIEKDDPRQFQSLLDLYRNELNSENKNHEKVAQAGPVTLGVRLSSSRFPNGFDAVSYGRGTWLLHMLRHLLRDANSVEGPKTSLRTEAKRGTSNQEEPFFRLLRRLQEQFAGRELSTADLQRAAEAELPASYRFEGRKSLDWFFQGWVNGTAIPSLSLSGVKLMRKGNAILASGAVVQKDAPKDLVTSVPIYASDGKNLTLLARIFAEGEKTSFELRAPATARRLVLDPYNTVLATH